MMPYKYAVECVCDKLAATKTYNGRAYTPSKALEHWQRYGNKVDGNPRTMGFIERCFQDLEALGERAVLNKKYMKRTYREICEKEEADDSTSASFTLFFTPFRYKMFILFQFSWILYLFRQNRVRG